MKKQILLALSLLCVTAFGKPVKTPESEEAARIWYEIYQDKPIVSLMDSRVLVKIFLLSPIGKKTIPARDMGLADIIISHFGTSAVRETISENALLKRAQKLKGEELSGNERERVRQLAEKQECAYRWKHPEADKFNFLIKDDAVNLHHTIKWEKSVKAALGAIARQYGLCCRYQKKDDLSVEELRLLLAGGNPVLLQERKTGKWLMAFGAWKNKGKDFVFLNDIENTTVVEGKPRGNADERQSMYLSVIKSLIVHQKFFDTNRKYSIARDIISDVSLQMPKLGFEAKPYHSGDYQAHVMTEWHESAEAWDGDLLKILKKLDPQTYAQQPPPAQDADPNLLWNYYFNEAHSNADELSSCLLPLTVFRLESVPSMLTNLVAVLSEQDATPWKFSLIPNMMWVALKSIQGNELLCPSQEELDALVRLGTERELVFKKRFEAFTGENYLMISGIDSPDERLESPHGKHRTSEWILSLLDNATTLQNALDRYATNTGKRAPLEGGHPVPWQICQRALMQKIPILLYDTMADDWRIAFGFLEHDARRLLVTVSPNTIDWQDGEKECHFGPGVPFHSGVLFEEFDKMSCIPYFIHSLEPDITSVKDQINEIFNSNPEAKKIP